ncbi:MAG: bifunctional phosphoglucose/phosphomannose isomerase [Bacteroidetes bacterium]|jgi:glucose/mannose-6-phosphate isomerase|nr:bifunctional phosphoglucose/phosphomannose isomerase [Bacteroidota bacterium]
MTDADLRRYDPSGMYDAIRTFAEQWRTGRERALQASLDGLHAEHLSAIVVVGMGGSAIGGDLLRTLTADVSPVPIVVVRNYRLPAWVGPQTLVIASSYSGNTEETLSALGEARERGAMLAGVTSGGEVQQQAETFGFPYVTLPGGMQPRAALGYSLTALLTLVERIGLVTLPPAAWREAQEALERQSAALSQLDDNRALTLAQELKDTLPFIYAGAGRLEAVALRWQTQIHENAKMLATGNLFPELNHNEIMGWEQPAPVHEQVSVVLLRDPADHPQVKRRMDVTRDLIGHRAAHWVEVPAEGQHPLARVLGLINLGDWVSFYLAMLRGIDPTPVDLIGRLKATLAA